MIPIRGYDKKLTCYFDLSHQNHRQ